MHKAGSSFTPSEPHGGLREGRIAFASPGTGQFCWPLTVSSEESKFYSRIGGGESDALPLHGWLAMPAGEFWEVKSKLPRFGNADTKSSKDSLARLLWVGELPGFDTRQPIVGC